MTIPVIQTKLSGEFFYEVRSKAGELTQIGHVDNLVLDGFFFNWLSSGSPASSYFLYCSLGSSTTPIIPGTTSISEIAVSRANYTTQEPLVIISPGVTKTGRGYTFASIVTPVTVNSLGINTLSTGGTLSAAAVLGAPINLIAGDVLTVKHYITATIALADRTGSIVLNSVSYPYTVRWINYTDSYSDGNLWTVNGGGGVTLSATTMGYGPVTCRQTQTLVASSSNPSSFPSTVGDTSTTAIIVADSYVSASYYRDLEFTFDYTKANLPLGIGNLIFLPKGNFVPNQGFYINFGTTRVPKDNTMELKLKFRFTWGS